MNGYRLSIVKNGINSYWRDPDGMIRPRRSGSRGQWSGLRVTVNTPTSIFPPDTVAKPGLKVFYFLLIKRNKIFR